MSQEDSAESDLESTTVVENLKKAIRDIEAEALKEKTDETKLETHDVQTGRGRQTRVCLWRRVWIWVLACARDPLFWICNQK